MIPRDTKETVMLIVCCYALGALIGSWFACANVYHCRSAFWCGGSLNPCNDAGLPTWTESDGGE